MKRKRHTYGTLFFLFLFFLVSSFDLRPDPYAIWESVDEKIQEAQCMFSLPPNAAERIKSLPLLSCSLPWAHESEGYACSPFNDASFLEVLFYLEEIFIVNLLPVTRFEDVVPYGVCSLHLIGGFQICHLDVFRNPTACFRYSLST